MRRMVWKGVSGVRILFDGLVLLSSASGLGVDQRLAQAQTRGSEGVYQIDVEGQIWHFHIAPGKARWRLGPHPSPRAVVNMSTDDLFKMLTGNTSFVTLSMTGRVKVQGDAHAAVLFGLLLTKLRAMHQDPRLSRRAARLWLDLAVRHSGTPHRFIRSEVHT